MKFSLERGFERIRNGESGLEYYPGYLPKWIRVMFTKNQHRIWRSTLKKGGVYDEVLVKLAVERDLTKRHKRPKGEVRQELLTWLEEHPEYKEFFTFHDD